MFDKLTNFNEWFDKKVKNQETTAAEKNTNTNLNISSNSVKAAASNGIVINLECLVVSQILSDDIVISGMKILKQDKTEFKITEKELIITSKLDIAPELNSKIKMTLSW